MGRFHPLEKALQVMLAGRDGVTVQRNYAHGEHYIRADAELREAGLRL